MNVKKLVINYGAIFCFFVFMAAAAPEDISDFGLLSVIPAVFLMLYILYTKRVMESLVLGSLLGFVMAYKTNFFAAFNENLFNIMSDRNIVWLFIVCGCMGAVIALIEKAGGAQAFGNFASKIARGPKSVMLCAWILSVIVFIDDYLICLVVGSSMSPVTDRFKLPREYLAYVVNSTAAPVCVLLPFSTWAAFIASLIEAEGLVPAGDGLKFYVQIIPYVFYGWCTVIIVLLVILGVIPIFGPMKTAFKRVRDTGELAPAGSESIDIRADGRLEAHETPRLYNFLLPIIFMIAATIYFDVDLQLGVLATLAFVFVLYIPQGLMTPEEFMDSAVSGMKNMLFPLILVVLAYSFANGAEAVGFMSYIIETGTTALTGRAWMLPGALFILLSITEFVMGLSWGMYAIAIPIAIPMAQNLGVSPVITVAAVCSAGVFGSHICFYSDATILAAAATGCNNFRHAITQMPFGLTAAVISLILFLLTGYWMYA